MPNAYHAHSMVIQPKIHRSRGHVDRKYSWNSTLDSSGYILHDAHPNSKILMPYIKYRKQPWLKNVIKRVN